MFSLKMKPILSIQNLNKVYAGGFQALKNINLEINKGEIFALLGPNGAGKTTLINTICGIVTPTNGTILVDFEEIHGVGLRRHCRAKPRRAVNAYGIPFVWARSVERVRWPCTAANTSCPFETKVKIARSSSSTPFTKAASVEVKNQIGP